MWGGPLSIPQAKGLWDAGVRNIKVGDGNAAVGGAGQWARQQASSWISLYGAAGGTVDAYIYLYMANDPIQQVAQAFQTLDAIAVRRWWLDAEDTQSAFLSIYQREQFLASCESEVTRRRGVCGLYTGGWWWKPNMGNSARFSHLPLWNSYYDDNPDESGLPYGGWQHSAVEQYAGTTTLGGMSVDLNYDSTLEEEEMGMTPAERAEFDALKRAVFAGSEQPGDDAARLAYANGKIAANGQSVNDVAESAMALIKAAHISLEAQP